MRSLRNFQNGFDTQIFEYLKKKRDKFSRIDSKLGSYVDILSEFIQNGGKRIRPALFYFATKSYGGDLNNAYIRSMAFEFFQTFCLIHDDIIDQSKLRRGKPTVHIKYDQNIAILVGDMALMFADEIFFSLECSNDVKKTYNHFKQEVWMGEYLDVLGSKHTQKVMELKTARYTFVRPVELALQISCQEKVKIEGWKKILLAIGKTFQLKDDLEGVFGDEKVMGKSSSSDLQEGKYTQLIQLFEHEATISEKKKFHQIFGKKNVSENDCKALKYMLKNHQIPQKISAIILTDVINIKKELLTIPEVELHHVLFEILSEIENMNVIHY